MGGGLAPSASNVLDYVAIASTGDFTDFGDLTYSPRYPGESSTSTRGLWGGGDVSETNQKNIDYITIASTGDAADFGDLSETKTYFPQGCIGDAHGGLQG